MARTRTHNRRRKRALKNPNEREKRIQLVKARKSARNRRNVSSG